MTIASFQISVTTTKRVRRSRCEAKSLDSKNFYHMAAALAHPDEDLLAGSSLLESDYQDCLFSFEAQGTREHVRPTRLQIIRALNKFLVAQKIDEVDHNIFSLSPNLSLGIIDRPRKSIERHGITYSPAELICLLAWASGLCPASKSQKNLHTKTKLSALSFHQELTTLAHRPRYRAFSYCGEYRNRHQDGLVERASLFSANRLVKKSWQISHSVLPGIRYYHAALHSNLPEPINVLYWLKFDEAHQIIAGEFISDTLPQRLFCPLEDLVQNAQTQTGLSGELMREIIDMYLASLGEK